MGNMGCDWSDGLVITRLYRTFVPTAAGLATLILLMVVLSARADGPAVDLQSSNAAISTLFGETADAKTGHAIATGDFNGDGYEDLVVGAPYADLVPFVPKPEWEISHCLASKPDSPLECVSGGVYVYLGRPEVGSILDLANRAANVTFYAPPDRYSGEDLGRSVAAGDLNGDGLDDVVIGASRYGPASSGAAFVWMGRASIGAHTAVSVNIKDQATSTTDGYNLKFVGAWTENYLGWDVAAGDVNGDNIDDLIVGAHLASVDTVTDTDYYPPDDQRYHQSAADRQESGAVYVRLGSTALVSSTWSTADPGECLPEMTIYGQDSYDHLGRSVATGDIDGDGIDDLVIGADGADPGEIVTSAGEVYVFYGSGVITHANYSPYPLVKELAYVTTTADIIITGVAPGERSGFDVGVGDLNGDGYDDIIIGAPYADGSRGRIYVVHGGAGHTISPTIIPLSQADLTVSGATSDTWLGASVLAGDLDDDGTDDLLMGAIGIDPDDADLSGSPGATRTGVAYALFGSGSLTGTVDLSADNPADLTILGGSADDWLGRGLGIGDLNGDTFNELLVGAAGADNTGGLTATGAAYLINLAYPQQITIDSTVGEVAAGNTVSFTATATTWLDTRDVTSQTAFAISPAAGGGWDSRVYTSSVAGIWTVTGTLDGLTDTTVVTVVPGPLQTVVVTPTTAFIAPSTITEFRASGWDGEGNPVSNAAFSWSIVNGGADIVSSGRTTLTAKAVVTDATYAHTVVARASAISGTASIVVSNSAPLADFACGSCSIGEGESLAFDASASCDPNRGLLTYSWDFGDSTAGSGLRPTHAYGDDGTYTVTLTVEDNRGLSDNHRRVVTVTNCGPWDVLISGPSRVDEGKSISLTGSAVDVVGDALTYTWDVEGDGAFDDGLGSSLVYEGVDGPASARVRLKVSDGDGGATVVTRSITVNNVAPEEVSISGDVEIAEGSSLPLAGLAADVLADSLVFQWETNGDGLFDDGAGSSFSFVGVDGPETVSIQLQVTDDDGASTISPAHAVSVTNVGPAPTITAPATAASGERVTFVANANDPGDDTFEYEWDWGDGSQLVITAASTIGHAFTSAGVYTVTLRVTDDDAGSGETRHAVNVMSGVPCRTYLPLVLR